MYAEKLEKLKKFANALTILVDFALETYGKIEYEPAQEAIENILDGADARILVTCPVNKSRCVIAVTGVGSLIEQANVIDELVDALEVEVQLEQDTESG